MNTLGHLGENIAAIYLELKGYRVIDRNFHVRGGEIDIICQRDGVTVFVEVKSRSSQRGGFPEESISKQKLNRIANAIEGYLELQPIIGPIRIEVVSVEFLPTGWPRVNHFTELGT